MIGMMCRLDRPVITRGVCCCAKVFVVAAMFASLFPDLIQVVQPALRSPRLCVSNLPGSIQIVQAHYPADVVAFLPKFRADLAAAQAPRRRIFTDFLTNSRSYWIEFPAGLVTLRVIAIG